LQPLAMSMRRAVPGLGELAMSIANLHIRTAYHPYSSSLTQLKSLFREWRQRARSRAELMRLSDMDYRDIGISRCDAAHESGKAFWMT
jgi:uncharacterized protein YjiS (DUF1127 family)